MGTTTLTLGPPCSARAASSAAMLLSLLCRYWAVRKVARSARATAMTSIIQVLLTGTEGSFSAMVMSFHFRVAGLSQSRIRVLPLEEAAEVEAEQVLEQIARVGELVDEAVDRFVDGGLDD